MLINNSIDRLGKNNKAVPQHYIDRSQPVVIFRERLVSEKANLESELGRRPDALYAAHVAVEDQSSITHDQFISLHRNNLAYTKLKEVEAALDRLRFGDYGTCEGCEDGISDRRLNAIPWARYCLTCQENESAGANNQKPDLIGRHLNAPGRD
jgi:DnaK suppressor protein